MRGCEFETEPEPEPEPEPETQPYTIHNSNQANTPEALNEFAADPSTSPLVHLTAPYLVSRLHL